MTIDLNAAAGGTDPKVGFSIDSAKLARLLRLVADCIESGQFLPQKLDTHSSLPPDDYLIHQFTLTYAEDKSKAPAPTVVS